MRLASVLAPALALVALLSAGCASTPPTPEGPDWITTLEVTAFGDTSRQITTTLDFAAGTVATVTTDSISKTAEPNGPVSALDTAAIAAFQTTAAECGVRQWKDKYEPAQLILDGGGTILTFTYQDGSTQEVMLVNVYEPEERPEKWDEFKQAVNAVAGKTVIEEF
jgi:hypothetical protein